MKYFFAPLSAIALLMLLVCDYSNAQSSSPEKKASVSCAPDIEQKQVSNLHWSKNEPWKKHWAIGAAAFMQGKFPEAEPEVAEALKLSKEAGYTDVQPSVLQMLGLIYMQQDKYEQAVSALQQAIDMEKANPTPFKGTIYAALIGLGDTYRREKLYDKALPPLLEAKSLMTPCNPGYWQLLENMAQTYVGLDKLPEAEVTYNDLLHFAEQSHSDDLMDRAFTGLEDVQLQRKEYAKLADTLERAYPYVVKKFGATSKEATIFAKNIQHVKDARDAQHVTVTYGGAAKQWMDLMASGNKKLDEKQYLLAASDFEKAVKLAEAEGTQTTTTALSRAKLGLAYSYVGNFKGAEIQLSKAISVLKQHPEFMSVSRLADYEKLYQQVRARSQSAR